MPDIHDQPDTETAIRALAERYSRSVSAQLRRPSVSSLAQAGCRQLVVCIEAIDPGIDRFRGHDASGGGRRARTGNALSLLGVPAPLVRACLGGRSLAGVEVQPVHDRKIVLSEPGGQSFGRCSRDRASDFLPRPERATQTVRPTATGLFGGCIGRIVVL